MPHGGSTREFVTDDDHGTRAGDAEYAPIGSQGLVIFLRSDKDAPNRKVIAVDLRSSQPSAWKTVVPEHRATWA